MSDDSTDTAPLRVAFVCVQNAGRSQMATAFAELERAGRGLEDQVDIHTGGTDPADAVHDAVVESMNEVGVDLSDRTPRAVSTAELESCDYVATMGCSTLSLDAGGDAGPDVRDWALTDPDGKPAEQVREIREEVRENVRSLFDDVEGELNARGRQCQR